MCIRDRDTIYQLPTGSREFYTLKAGDEYNLKHRAVITYRNREFINLTENELMKYCGEYQLPENEGRAEFFVKDGSLILKEDNRTYTLYPETITRFYLSQSEFSFDFVFDLNSKITKVIVPGINETWEKLD